MSGLIPQRSRGRSSSFTEGTQRRGPSRDTRQLFDILQRGLIGAATQITDIPTQLQRESIGGLRNLIPQILQSGSGGLASRLARPSSQVPQFGGSATPSREDIGLTESRRDLFPFTPTPEEVEELGLLRPLRESQGQRKGKKRTRKLGKRIGKLKGKAKAAFRQGDKRAGKKLQRQVRRKEEKRADTQRRLRA